MPKDAEKAGPCELVVRKKFQCQTLSFLPLRRLPPSRRIIFSVLLRPVAVKREFQAFIHYPKEQPNHP